MDEILHKGYMLYQYIGKLGRLLSSDIPGYISVDEMNYGLIEMQSYIGSFTSGQKDFNITTIDMLRDVFKELGDFLLCIGESAQAILKHVHTTCMIHTAEISMVCPMQCKWFFNSPDISLP